MSYHTGTEAYRRAPKAVPHIGIAVHLIQYIAVYLIYSHASPIQACTSYIGVHLIYTCILYMVSTTCCSTVTYYFAVLVG